MIWILTDFGTLQLFFFPSLSLSLFSAGSFIDRYPARHIFMQKRSLFTSARFQHGPAVQRTENWLPASLFLLDATVPVTYCVNNTLVLSAI